MPHDAAVLDAHWSNNGSYVVTGSLNTSARVWDATGDQAMELGDDHRQWWLARFSFDSRRILVGGPEGVMIWELPPPADFERVNHCRGYKPLDNDQVDEDKPPADCT
jgi:hypothetical protein